MQKIKINNRSQVRQKVKINHIKKTKENLKKIYTFIKKHNVFIQTCLNLFMLLLTIIAIVISIIVFNSSNKQFSENSKKSDSLFDYQLNKQKSFNDSIISNLQKIQNLTNKQNAIIDQQLSISSLLLNDQVNSGVPKFILNHIELKDKDVKYNDINAPIIYYVFKNVGNRYAYNVKVRSFAISSDFLEIRKNDNMESSEPAGPSVILECSLLPKFTNYKIPFYFCTEITYTDKATGKLLKNTSYKEYSKLRNILDFYDCDKLSIEKIKMTINNELKKTKNKLLE